MNKVYYFFVVLLFLKIGCIDIQAYNYDIVVIDPGHGGTDRGCASYGLKEKNLNLDVSRRLRSELSKRGVRSRMTRSKDVFVSLSRRAVISNSYRRPIFVSIHHNANKKRWVKGLETYYLSNKGRVLANKIQRNITKVSPMPNRKTIRKNFAVLRLTNAPAVLVELGYLSNPIENKVIKKSYYRQRLAKAIADAIVSYRY